MSQTPFEALKLAIEKGNEISFWGNSKPKCPHCGQQMNDYEEYDHIFAEYDHILAEGEHDMYCSHCELPFTCSVDVIWRYSTDHLPKEERK